MKRLLVTIILLLVILAIGQAIYYKYNVKNEQINISQEINSIQNEQIEKSLYMHGIDNLYENFYPNISREDLQKKMYNFVCINLPQIYMDTLNMTAEEIKNYYNEKNINQSVGVYSEEDFIIIVKQLQNIYYTRENIILSETKIDTESISRNPNGLIDFNVTLDFDNERSLEIKVIISEQEDTFIILSNSNLDKIFKKYAGDVKKEEILEKIDNLVANVDRIRQNTTLKTDNEKSQYFDLNEDDMKNVGISTAEDFIKVANQVNSMKWINGKLRFQNYEIDYNSLIQDENYSSFKIILYYNYESKIEIIVSIRNNRNIEPKIKISGDESDFQHVNIENNIIEE